MSEPVNAVNFSHFRRVLTMVRPYRRTFYFTAALAVLLAPLAIARPKLLQTMVDDHVFQGDVPGMTFLAAVIVGVLLVEVVLVLLPQTKECYLVLIGLQMLLKRLLQQLLLALLFKDQLTFSFMILMMMALAHGPIELLLLEQTLLQQQLTFLKLEQRVYKQEEVLQDRELTR